MACCVLGAAIFGLFLKVFGRRRNEPADLPPPAVWRVEAREPVDAVHGR